MRRADVVKIEPNRASFAAARKMLAALSENLEALECILEVSDRPVDLGDLRYFRNTGGGQLPAPSPRGATQRRRSAAGLSAGQISAPAMRRNGAADPAESGENPQGTITAGTEARP